VAIAAPAMAASFPDSWARVHGWLQSMGVRDFFDVSFGAELTVRSYLEYAGAKNPATIIAQPCPAIVSYVELYQPELIPYLAPADSPMVHTIKMVREYFPGYAGCKVLVLSPCLAKRREFDATGLGDYNVTYTSIMAYLEREGINLNTFPEVEFVGSPAERAVLFSSPGGLQRTVERENPEIARRTRKIEGPHVVYDYLKSLPGAIAKGCAPILVDCLNCEIGCNGGPGTLTRGKGPDEIESHIEARRERARAGYRSRGIARSESAARRRVRRTVSRYWRRGLYERRYTDRSPGYPIEIPDNRRLEAIYERMLKHSRQDFLNCGSCGYGSCELMATAIHNELNRPENCFHYERESRLEITRLLFDGIRQTSEKLTVAVNRITGQGDPDGEEEAVSMRDIAEISRGMRESIEAGLGHIERTITTMQTIRATNESTAARMTVLNEQIQSIWEIVGIISAIADQTKIIAFNAELEASAAGNTGRSFEIVAAEIRRLANSTVSSTARIREKISEIQASSTELAESSRKEGESIGRGVGITSDLKAVFDDLADYSAQTDQRINTSIETQVEVFEGAMQELDQIRRQMDKQTT
jgi:hypothetical protein